MFNLKTGYFPDGASDKESTCQSRRNKTHGFYTCVGKISWSGAGNTLQWFLPGESHGQRSLADS